MGSSKSKIKPINSDCPVCYETPQDPIILNCGHLFDNYCIQRASLNFILKNELPSCPLCRKNIEISKMKEVFNEWKIFPFNPTEWNNYNTIIFNKNLKISKVSILELSPYLYTYTLYFNHEKFDKPFFFHYNTKIILKISDFNLLDKCFPLCLESDLDNHQYYMFLKNNFINKIKFNHKISKNKILFQVKNLDKIIIYDEVEGTMHYGLILKDRPCTPLFRMYLLRSPLDFYIVNELFGILYH